MRTYRLSVCSTLTHSSEAWTLTAAVSRSINGFNSRCLHVITGRDYRDTATAPQYDLLRAIHQRRLYYLEHVLRMPESRVALSQRVAPATLRALSSWTARPTRSTTWRRSHSGVRPRTILYTAYYELTLPNVTIELYGPIVPSNTTKLNTQYSTRIFIIIYKLIS